MSDIEDLLRANKINLPRYNPGRYYVTCPRCSAARKPKNQKSKVLGVSIRDGRVFWGCNHCGWTGPEKGATAYQYPGRTKFRVNDKDFRWEKSGEITPDALYRIDEALEHDTICIVEGEKDVNTMWTHDIPATCNAHGAGKWTADHSKQLKDHAIVVFNDNDEAGYEHAKTIIDCSLGIATSVRRVDLKEHWPGEEMPEGGDVSDWFAAGGDAIELERIIAEAPVINGQNRPQKPRLAVAPTYSMAELKERIFLPLKWIVPRFFPEGTTLLAGKPKVGKSWLMLATAVAVANGEKILGETCEKRDVLYFALEDNPRRLKARGETLLGLNVDWPINLHFVHQMPAIDHGASDHLEQHIDNRPGLALVIIDTFGKIKGGRTAKEEPYAHDYRTMSAIHDVSQRKGVNLIVVHHLRKQTADDVFDTMSGTLGLTAVPDTLSVLTRTKNRDSLRFAVRGRDIDPEDKTVYFDADMGTWEVTGDYEEETDSGCKSVILACLRDNPGGTSMTPKQVSEKTGLPLGTVQGTLRRMFKDGKVSRSRYGSYFV